MLFTGNLQVASGKFEKTIEAKIVTGDIECARQEFAKKNERTQHNKPTRSKEN